MPRPSIPPSPPPAADLDVPGRRIARVLRVIRVVSAVSLVVLTTAVWATRWPVPDVGPAAAGGVLAGWLLATNLWSRWHDHHGTEDAGITVEVTSDLVLVTTLTLVGGELVTRTLPLAAVLVVVELAVRWPARRAAVATALFAGTWAAAVLLEWPSWAGWTQESTALHLVTPLVSFPVVVALVGWLARDRAQTRDVAIGQARRLTLVAHQLRAVNDQLAGSNAELSAFAARIAHDLRSPLATVVMALETLDRHDPDLPEETRAMLLAQAQRAATRAVDTVQALLDHASADGRAAEVVPVDVREVAADVVATLPGPQLGEVEVTLPDEPVIAWAEPRLLSLVLQNLVTNALSHGGPALRRVGVRCHRVDGAAVVSVEDDGVGIPADRRPAVFSVGRGESTSSGLGLGLATCRSIVERHGGRIWAESSDLGGAALRFTLPDPVDRRASSEDVVDLGAVEAPDAQRTLATSSSSGSSSRTSSAPYRPGSAPTTTRTSSAASSASRTSPSTV